MRGLLEALDEPAFLLTSAGIIRDANGAALRLLGQNRERIVGTLMHALAADPPEELDRLLRRFAGSGRSVLGALRAREAGGGTVRLRCRGCRIAGPDGEAEPLLLLRLQDSSHERFMALTDRIVALNAEIRRSEHLRLQLQAAVEQTEILLRELHHRVKNNLQTLLGILSMAERKVRLAGAVAGPTAAEVLRDARMRVEAMAVLQRVLYRRESLDGVNSLIFLTDLCSNVERAFRRPGIAVRTLPTDVIISLDVAQVMGLVVSELLANAFKHAFPDREQGEITVNLHEDDGEGHYVLVVEDDGCGPGARLVPGTGLSLVQGLVQRHGGSCRIETGRGTRCVVTLRHHRHPRPAPPG